MFLFHIKDWSVDTWCEIKRQYGYYGQPIPHHYWWSLLPAIEFSTRPGKVLITASYLCFVLFINIHNPYKQRAAEIDADFSI